MGEYTGQSYQPSNGSEGSSFEDRFCMRCIHCDPNPEGKKQCAILGNALCYSPGDANYPKEWQYDANDNPTCTAHVKWDWDTQGNPDDQQNENYVQPPDPDQLDLFASQNDSSKPNTEEPQ